jgi:hypothetical protein
MLAGVLGVGCDVGTTTTHSATAGPAGSSAAAAATSSKTGAAVSRRTPSSTVSHPVPIAAAAATARVFATAYGRYLDGQLRATGLPDATSTARTQVEAMIPPARRAGTIAVQSVQQTPAHPTFTIALRDRAHTFTAQLTLAPIGGRWLVVAVAPPDLDTILAPAPRPIPQPAGSRPPEHAARAFVAGYLPWLYGHAPLHAITGATRRLIEDLKAHPPRVPPTMQALRPKAAAIAIQHRRRHWHALANINDGHETYELMLTLARTRGTWLVSNVGSKTR